MVIGLLGELCIQNRDLEKNTHEINAKNCIKPTFTETVDRTNIKPGAVC